MSLKDLMGGGDRPERTEEQDEANEAAVDAMETAVHEGQPARNEDGTFADEDDLNADAVDTMRTALAEEGPEDESFVTSADIDARLIVRSVQVDTAEEEFRATSAEGFDTLIRALRAEERPYRVINRFTGKVYDSFLDFVPPAQAE